MSTFGNIMTIIFNMTKKTIQQMVIKSYFKNKKKTTRLVYLNF